MLNSCIIRGSSHHKETRISYKEINFLYFFQKFFLEKSSYLYKDNLINLR